MMMYSLYYIKCINLYLKIEFSKEAINVVYRNVPFNDYFWLFLL